MRDIKIVEGIEGQGGMAYRSIQIAGRTLQSSWTVEAAQDMAQYHPDVDLVYEISKALIEQVDYELDCNNEASLSREERELLKELIKTNA
jgi:hypothetical protein